MNSPVAPPPLESHAQDAMSALVRILQRGGCSEEAIRAGLEVALKCPPPPEQLVPPGADREMTEAAHILTLWYQEAEYVDAQGEPKALLLRGSAPSFEALVRQVANESDMPRLLRYLRHSRAIRRVRGRLVPTRRLVMLRGIPGPATSRNIRGIAAMLRTNEYNLTPSREPQGRFERNCENAHFPVSRLAEFAALLDLEGMALLKRLDQFLRECEAQRDPDEPTIILGVGIYRYQE